MADDTFKRQVLEATDIVALISQSVSLKRRGSSYVGLCPFHNEKTPSFHVTPEKRYFRCFGCKESGNAIDFIIKRDRMDFLAALKFLAEQAGLEMPKFGMSKEKSSERQQLFDLHAAAADVFHRNLLHPALGKPARDYLASRGFTDATITAFKIGYAPPGWDHLLRSRDLAPYPPGLLALGGVIKSRPSGDGHYDTFRNRLMFPIRDEQGRTIAFGGRVMPGSDDPAKYLNSPETPLFSKSKCVFGMDLGRHKVVESRTVAVVEGYTDVAMAHQFGATNVVSILGTAMTEPHITLLRRFADRIVLLFDADTAGETAVNRAVELFLTQPVEIAIASIPENLDPDEYLLKHGAPAFDNLLKTASDALAFKWKLLQRDFDAADGSLTGQQKAVEAYLSLLASARGSGPIDSIRWGQVLRRTERLTGVPLDMIQERVAKLAPRTRTVPTPSFSPPHPPTPQMRGQSSANSAPSEPAESPQSPPPPQSEAVYRAERWILGILLAQPARWVHLQVSVSPELFSDPSRRQLADIYWDRQRNEGEPDFSELLNDLPESLRQTAINLFEDAEKLKDVETTLLTALQYFSDERRRLEEARLRTALNNGQEGKEQEELLRQLQSRMGKGDIRRLGPR